MDRRSDAEAAKARAEALFRGQQLLDAVEDNRSAIETARIAEVEKTARLRELRLAKERSDQIAAEVRRERRQR